MVKIKEEFTNKYGIHFKLKEKTYKEEYYVSDTIYINGRPIYIRGYLYYHTYLHYWHCRIIIRGEMRAFMSDDDRFIFADYNMKRGQIREVLYEMLDNIDWSILDELSDFDLESILMKKY